jgi:hypothetical protein
VRRFGHVASEEYVVNRIFAVLGAGATAVILSGCGGHSALVTQTTGADVATASPTPSDACGFTAQGTNLHALQANNSNRAKATDLDSASAKEAVISPSDPKSFIAHVTKADLINAGLLIITPPTWPDSMILAVNHGSWTAAQLHGKVRGGVSKVGDQTFDHTNDVYNWQVVLYSPADKLILGEYFADEGNCFHE